MNPELYSATGALSKMFYGNDYMPYENMVPAVDIMRANNNNPLKYPKYNLQYPQYYLQYIDDNTTPLANRM